MKKELTILFIVMLIAGMIIAVAGDDILIGREVEISGIGVINADLDLDTTSDFSGLILCERISTPGAGFREASEMKYYSSFDIGLYNKNDTANSSSVLEYESVAKIINAKRAVYSRNYMLGAIMGMKAKGDTNHEVSMYSDDFMSTAEIEGGSIGHMMLFQKVVDIKDHHSVIASDVITLDGNYNLKWNAYAERYAYPEDENNAWLGCP